MAVTTTTGTSAVFRPDVRRIGTLTRAVGLLKGLVADSSTAASRPPSVQHVVLRRFMEMHDEASRSDAASEPTAEAPIDPVRAAAINRIRQLRIHAA